MVSDKLITRISTITELKQLLTEIIINNTDKVSKVSDESVLNALIYGVAKIAQKQLKDVAVIESLIIPESATGEALDRAGLLFGGVVRSGSSPSSTFVRVKANAGVEYVPGVHTFISSSGVQFETMDFVTVGVNGYAYVPVRSINLGSNSNVAAQTITSVTPVPVGHISCTNEYMAVGGVDSESDEDFKIRIKSYPNLQAQNTLAYLLEVIRLTQPTVLRIFNLGMEHDKVNIRLVTENGAFFTSSELSGILSFITPYLCLVDIYKQGNISGIKLENIDWLYIDMDFRVKISSSTTIDSVRYNAQVALSKYLDFRYWKEEDSVQWDDMLQIVKSVVGVDYVPDEFFSPNTDIPSVSGQLPRIRGFIMRDLSGNILFNSTSNLTPIFYENGI